MILPDDFRELRRPQSVGERTRRVGIEAGGFEQARAAFRLRAHPCTFVIR